MADASLGDVVKPKTKKGKRALEEREAKLLENTKKAIMLRGTSTSDLVNHALADLHQLKRPFSTLYRKKNPIRPFEDITSLEFFSKKADASLFAFGNHSKKRPHNLILGRMYNYRLLDMFELGITHFKSLSDFKCMKCTVGSKPGLIFVGEAFETESIYVRLKSLLIDFFRGPTVTKIRLQGLEHVIQISTVNQQIYFRCFKVLLKKSGSRIPRIELEEMGPRFNFQVRRTTLGSEELMKEACKIPTMLKPKKEKNVAHDTFGTKVGRVHIQSQNLDSIQTRKLKALKRKSDAGADGTSESTSKRSKKE